MKYAVRTDEGHFNDIKTIQEDVKKLSDLFQNEGMEITEKEVATFRSRYQEISSQLENWYINSLDRITKIKEAK